MNAKQARKDVRLALATRETLIWIETFEEMRAERAVADVAASMSYSPVTWDCSAGAQVATVTETATGRSVSGWKIREIGDAMLPATVPAAAIAAIRGKSGREVWILRDFDKWLADPTVERGLKTLGRELQAARSREDFGAIVVLATSPPPESLRAIFKLIVWPLPDRNELGTILDSQLDVQGLDANGQRDKIIEAAVGLTADGAASAYARSLVDKGEVLPALVAEEKKRALDGIDGLSWSAPEPEGLDAIGGLEIFKAWAVERGLAWTPAAKTYNPQTGGSDGPGLPTPKGAFLLGAPGCGKTLAARCLAASWGVPLLTLDLGAAKGKYVGESEAAIRRILRIAETIGRCVLHVDEIEKAISGGSADTDGGVSQDFLGVLLQWLQNKTAPVFVLATANDVSGLPPELLRVGRWDALFMVDLPHAVERAAIFRVAGRKLGLDLDATDEMIEASEGFSGAEIAGALGKAIFAAFAAERAVEDGDICDALASTTPLAITMREEMKRRRDWARGRAMSASASPQEMRSTEPVARTLDV